MPSHRIEGHKNVHNAANHLPYPNTMTVFPFADYWWFYAVFGGLILLLLLIDASVQRRQGQTSMKAASRAAAVWVLLGLLFGSIIYALAAAGDYPAEARRMALEYLAGYLVEESLSVDNMFVFALIFRCFSLDSAQQHRVLFYGIAGAMLLRGVFVAAGSAVITFRWAVIGFGLFLVVSGLRMVFAGEKKVDPESNAIVRAVRRFLPVSERLSGTRFLIREAGRIALTPLMVILLLIETTDVMFAIDSVPAVFGVTREPLVVYTSNVFAILGLRALYFVLSSALDLWHLLKYGLSAVLVFVGLKMSVLDELAGGRVPIGLSLGVIAGAIAVSIGLSLLFPRPVTPPAPAAGGDQLTGASKGSIHE